MYEVNDDRYYELVEGVEVADIHLDELVVGTVLDVLEVGQIAGISQLVKIDDLVLGIFVDKEADHMASNESCTSGDDYVSFHCIQRVVSCEL